MKNEKIHHFRLKSLFFEIIEVADIENLKSCFQT